jgi:hypothetical protein
VNNIAGHDVFFSFLFFSVLLCPFSTLIKGGWDRMVVSNSILKGGGKGVWERGWGCHVEYVMHENNKNNSR